MVPPYKLTPITEYEGRELVHIRRPLGEANKNLLTSWNVKIRWVNRLDKSSECKELLTSDGWFLYKRSRRSRYLSCLHQATTTRSRCIECLLLRNSDRSFVLWFLGPIWQFTFHISEIKSRGSSWTDVSSIRSMDFLSSKVLFWKSV